MATVPLFTKCFGIQKSKLELGGYRLARITMENEVLVRYERYEFPTTLVFKPLGTDGGDAAGAPEKLLALFKEHVGGERVSASRRARPHRLQVVSNCCCVAVRIRAHA